MVTSDLEKGQILFYESDTGKEGVSVYLADDTMWLSLSRMADLFDRDKSVISRHLKNIFQDEELDRDAVVAKNATTAADGKTYQVDFYNLDAIISVGYRVNSKRGTQFRIWATKVLKEHLVKGFTVNRQRLAEKGVQEAQQVLVLLADTLESHDLVNDEGRSVLSIVNRYARTWRLLLQYDEDRLPLPERERKRCTALEISRVRKAIGSLKAELIQKGEATDLFGNERNNGLEGILGSIYQTFDGYDLYPSLEEKAANLLYFIVKDHPFTDGNKRIGSFLFILFLQMNDMLIKSVFDNKALVALTLLTATSAPSQKDVLIRLIVNLLSENPSGEP